jgi:hypothetical protein
MRAVGQRPLRVARAIRSFSQIDRAAVSSDSPLPPTPTAAKEEPEKFERSSRRRILFRGVWIVYLCGLLAVAGWAYWAHRTGQLTTPASSGKNEFWRTYYSELAQSGVMDAQTSPDDGYVDVVMLGASVLEDASKPLEEQLRAAFGDRLRVYQLARAAHTSRDSAIKFDLIKDKHFDLIINYDGVNDVRMNCCPESEYRDDYTHCRWYRSILRKQQGAKAAFTDVVGDDLAFSIPLGEPEAGMLQYGNQIKTERAFQHNIEQIVTTAREKNELVVLMTFAYYIPADYSREKFDQRVLDYGVGHHTLPAEIWGTPENLARTLDKQNLVIDALAAQYDNVVLVDQRKLMPANGTNFSDPCHLTGEGNRRFVENLIPAILARLKPAKPKN